MMINRICSYLYDTTLQGMYRSNLFLLETDLNTSGQGIYQATYFMVSFPQIQTLCPSLQEAHCN